MNKTELKILKELADGNNSIKSIAKAIKKSDKQVYKASRKLDDFITRSRSGLEPKKATHTILLLQLLSEFPNLTGLLSDSGINILFSLPNTIKDIAKETCLKKSIVYRKIRQAIRISAVKKENKRYLINDRIWPKLKEFIAEFKKHQETVDARIPANSSIYYKSDKEILFASKSKQNASMTAFSAYNDYGIKLLLPTNYYYLPKKRLSKKEVFRHSLYVTEKEKTIRNLTYIVLFYLKHKIKINHPLLDMIKLILGGKDIEGYPKLKEIKEKAELYDIRV